MRYLLPILSTLLVPFLTSCNVIIAAQAQTRLPAPGTYIELSARTRAGQVTPTSDGGFFVAGLTRQSDGEWMSALRIDGDGLLQWARVIDGVYAPYAESPFVFQYGYEFAGGEWTPAFGAPTRDGGAAVLGAKGPFNHQLQLVKLDASGEFEWSNEFTSQGTAGSVFEMDDGTIIVSAVAPYGADEISTSRLFNFDLSGQLIRAATLEYIDDTFEGVSEETRVYPHIVKKLPGDRFLIGCRTDLDSVAVAIYDSDGNLERSITRHVEDLETGQGRITTFDVQALGDGTYMWGILLIPYANTSNSRDVVYLIHLDAYFATVSVQRVPFAESDYDVPPIPRAIAVSDGAPIAVLFNRDNYLAQIWGGVHIAMQEVAWMPFDRNGVLRSGLTRRLLGRLGYADKLKTVFNRANGDIIGVSDGHRTTESPLAVHLFKISPAGRVENVFPG